MFSLDNCGRPKTYFRFPVLDGTVNSWIKFAKSYTTSFMSTLQRKSFGTVRQGIILLSRMLHTMDANASIEGVKDAGGIVCSRLSPPETVALQLRAGITAKARISVNSSLTTHLGSPVFASESKCKQIELVNIPTTNQGILCRCP